MEKKKEYKAGQIVTIDGEIYRIKKDNVPCMLCNIDNGKARRFCVIKLRPHRYLERITPKHPRSK